jgi:arabinose-5-phosphate isomerase
MQNHEIVKLAQDVFDREIDALRVSREMLGKEVYEAAHTIMTCTGKIVTMGIGKSGLVARKIAATLSSTGTQAVYVHPVECLHGDMGMILPQDIVLLLSNSGESDEIRKLLVFLKTRKISIIAVTARQNSYLGRMANIVITYSVPREACPMGMAPMASTTVQMVIGDALASVLIKLHNFQPDNFAEFHPAGTLGKRLLLKVEHLMHSGEDNPLVKTGVLMKDALLTMTGKAMGAVVIINQDYKLLGILTDGDLRRAIQRFNDIMNIPVDKLMTQNPVSVHQCSLAIEALRLMEKRSSQISVLPVVDDLGNACGIIRLHDLVIAGL